MTQGRVFVSRPHPRRFPTLAMPTSSGIAGPWFMTQVSGKGTCIPPPFQAVLVMITSFIHDSPNHPNRYYHVTHGHTVRQSRIFHQANKFTWAENSVPFFRGRRMIGDAPFGVSFNISYSSPNPTIATACCPLWEASKHLTAKQGVLSLSNSRSQALKPQSSHKRLTPMHTLL